jgi:hypothetical protein
MKFSNGFAPMAAGLLVLIMCVSVSAWDTVPRYCPPERCIPPESVGEVDIPFDVPIWPTLLKTEFHVLPWVKWGKASVCIPGVCKALEFSCPSFSLKALPVWIPWLRPLDVECEDEEVCAK